MGLNKLAIELTSTAERDLNFNKNKNLCSNIRKILNLFRQIFEPYLFQV